MMNRWMDIADNEWFALVCRQPGIDEVNFRQSGGKTVIGALRPGDFFLLESEW
jgi:hypothetical protein